MSKFQFECKNCSAYIPIIEIMYGKEKQCWKCSSMNTVPDYSKKNIDADKSIKNNNKKNNQNHYKTTLRNKSKNELSELLNQISTELPTT